MTGEEEVVPWLLDGKTKLASRARLTCAAARYGAEEKKQNDEDDLLGGYSSYLPRGLRAASWVSKTRPDMSVGASRAPIVYIPT